jgi:hypothetical protein
MDYYFLKNRFFQKKPFSEEIFLQYLADRKVWQSRKFDKNSNPDIQTVLEQQKLIQNFCEKQWIVLKKVAGEPPRQEGPYSAREIFEFLQSSQLSSKDFLWKKGFSQWVELSKTDVFRGLFLIEENVYFSETANILEAIVEMRRPEMQRVDTKSSLEDDNAVFIIHD